MIYTERDVERETVIYIYREGCRERERERDVEREGEGRKPQGSSALGHKESSYFNERNRSTPLSLLYKLLP